MLSVAFQCRVVLYLSKMCNLNANVFWIKWHGCFRVAEIAAFFIWDAAICESLFSLYNNTDIVVLVLLLEFVSICFSHLFPTTLFQIFLGLVFFSLLKFVLLWALFLIFTIFYFFFLTAVSVLTMSFFLFFLNLFFYVINPAFQLFSLIYATLLAEFIPFLAFYLPASSSN